ncbi:Hypothetical predicted protein, partial [Lynx pardinus]
VRMQERILKGLEHNSHLLNGKYYLYSPVQVYHRINMKSRLVGSKYTSVFNFDINPARLSFKPYLLICICTQNVRKYSLFHTLFILVFCRGRICGVEYQRGRKCRARNLQITEGGPLQSLSTRLSTHSLTSEILEARKITIENVRKVTATKCWNKKLQVLVPLKNIEKAFRSYLNKLHRSSGKQSLWKPNKYPMNKKPSSKYWEISWHFYSLLLYPLCYGSTLGLEQCQPSS